MLERYVTDEFNAADKDFSSGMLLFFTANLFWSLGSLLFCPYL